MTEQPARRTRDPEDKKRRILAAAIAEFAEHGPSEARTDDIAARAGVNKQLLFRYFESKEKLFVAVLERVFDVFGEQLRDLPADLGDRLAHSNDTAADGGPWLPLVTWEALAFGDGTTVRQRARRDRYRAEVERMRAEQDAGRLPAGLDAAQLLLSIQSLAAFSYALPQYPRLVTGRAATDPEFQRERREHLRALGRLIAGR